jgi:hypothetical protein
MPRLNFITPAGSQLEVETDSDLSVTQIARLPEF